MFETLARLVNPIRQSWLTHGHYLTNALAPPVCLLCGGEGRDGRECDPPGAWGLDLCHHCEQACERIRVPCRRCGQPVANAAAECAACLVQPPPFDSTFCIHIYQDPVDRLVTQLKFQGQLACARVLGMLFAQALRASDRPLPQCLVPLPSHPVRHRERGFCHTTEIARHLARRLEDPQGRRLAVRTDLLLRIRATRAQSGLAAGDRARNLQDAFAVPAGRILPDTVALLDDVMTTGHTAAAASRALKAAGCRHVEVWCCARALAAERGTSLSALVKGFPEQLGAGESEAERLRRQERALRERIDTFRAGDRLSREELHERHGA